MVAQCCLTQSNACYLLGKLEIDNDKLLLSKMTPNFMNIGKENISISNILEVVAKLQKFSKCEALYVLMVNIE